MIFYFTIYPLPKKCTWLLAKDYSGHHPLLKPIKTKIYLLNGDNYLPSKPEIVAFNTSRWGTSKNNGLSIPWEGEFDILDSKYGDKYCWENFEMPLSTVLLKAWAIPSIKLLIGFIDSVSRHLFQVNWLLFRVIWLLTFSYSEKESCFS